MTFFSAALRRGLSAWLAKHGIRQDGDQAVAASIPSDDARYLFGQGRRLLHVGCGQATKADTGPGFQSDEWREIRLDIDPEARPDIVGSILDMPAVPDGAVDAVFSSHTLEHLYAHEIPVALAEMRRVLRDDGVVIATVPDLQAAARMIADDRLFDMAYESPAGTITPFDIVFSYRGFAGRDRPYMAHHSGFTLTTLVQAFRGAGFGGVIGICQPVFTLYVLATKQPQSDDTLRQLASEFIPGCQAIE